MIKIIEYILKTVKYDKENENKKKKIVTNL